MKEKFKTLLYKILGQKRFIQTLYAGYKLSYHLGFLKKDPIYKYHYFSKSLIQKGDTVLDIGANVGYYTYLFQQWVGPGGRVYAVEPVPQFMANLKKNHEQHENVTLWNYALGTEEKRVELVVPGQQEYLRTGLAHIKEEGVPTEESKFTFQATMKKASELFRSIEKIDFIKIDIEGYEVVVLPEMKAVLAKHLPIIQAETYGEQRAQIHALLEPMAYEAFELEGGQLIPSEQTKETTYGDLIYLTPAHRAKFMMA